MKALTCCPTRCTRTSRARRSSRSWCSRSPGRRARGNARPEILHSDLRWERVYSDFLDCNFVVQSTQDFTFVDLSELVKCEEALPAATTEAAKLHRANVDNRSRIRVR